MSTINKIDDDAFIFAGQDDDVFADEKDTTKGAWKILIVDDEPEIHKVSELALDNLEILGKRLEFINAYTGQEAIDVLKNESDIAVILLDVVMESDDAGLKAVKRIRDELELRDVRIILRTGQPGYAPEEQVVMQYDINDYRTKTELTRNKLLTSVFSAIRSFSQIMEVRKSKDFLDKLNSLNTKLIDESEYRSFVRCLVSESIKLFGLNGEGLLLIDHPLQAHEVNHEGFWQVFGTDKFKEHTGEKYEKFLPSDVVTNITTAIKEQTHQIFDDKVIIYIKAQSCSGLLYIETDDKIELSTELLRTFVSNISSDLDNSLLLQRISDIAYSCPLTNLPNRTRFIQMLDEYTAGRLPGNTAALVDLDHFSDINDGLGQEVGNSLLVSVAARLQQELPEAIVARIGADIYGLIGDDKSLDHERIQHVFDLPFKADEHVIPVNASVGISRKLDNDKTGLSVLKHANIALNRAKKDIRSRHSYYQPEMEDETSWRLGMIRRLTADFRAGKLEVWYQPQVKVASREVIGMEALLRWPDGDGGYISPVTFIPLAEYSGLIVDIGAWVLEQSCQELHRLSDLGFNNLRVAINVSMPQFRNTNFVDEVDATVKRFGIKPEDVELEITESVVMDDPKLVVKALENLKSAGFSIAIDDFGTGFSSLSYLQQLPLDRLKVDREFIKGIGEGDPGIIAETVINLGQKLGLETIAEGIENEHQLNWVNNLGCDESQGYFHAKPMPVKELEAFLAEHFKNT